MRHHDAAASITTIATASTARGTPTLRMRHVTARPHGTRTPHAGHGPAPRARGPGDAPDGIAGRRGESGVAPLPASRRLLPGRDPSALFPGEFYAVRRRNVPARLHRRRPHRSPRGRAELQAPGPGCRGVAVRVPPHLARGTRGAAGVRTARPEPHTGRLRVLSPAPAGAGRDAWLRLRGARRGRSSPASAPGSCIHAEGVGASRRPPAPVSAARHVGFAVAGRGAPATGCRPAPGARCPSGRGCRLSARRSRGCGAN